MGSIIKGTCKKCGYETGNLYLGGGMMNFKTHCGFPVLDKVKKEIKMENIQEKKLVVKKNPDLIFYDNELLFDENSQNRKHFIGWDNYQLYQEGYLCPKCNQFSLGFFNVGLWD